MRRSLSFRVKLITIFSGFAVIALCLSIIGYFVLHGLSGLDRETYEKQTVPTAEISNIIENMLIISNSFNTAVIEINNSGSVQTCQSQAEKLNTQTQSLIAKITPVTDEVKSEFEQGVLIYNNVFLPDSEQIFSLLSTGETDAAVEIINSLNPKTEEMTGHFNKCRDLIEDWSSGNRAANQRFFVFMQGAMLVAAPIIILLWVLFCIFVPNSMSRPVELVAKIASCVGGTGNLEIPEELRGDMDKAAARNDEFGKTLLAFSDMIKMFRNRADTLTEMAGGDMSMNINLVSPHDTIGVSLQTLLTNFNKLFGEISRSAEQTANASKQISAQSRDMARDAAEQNAIIERLNVSVNAIASHNSAANENGEEKSDVKISQMDRMMQAVEEIDEAGNSIGRIIKIIDSIAFQTNILALNATVEAAHAGEYGRGFAAVAEEVRSLASRSAEAAKDTGILISNSIEKAKLGLSIAAETSASLQEIVNGLREVAKIVRQNSAAAGESAAEAEKMSGQSQILQELVERFKIKDADFLPPKGGKS